MTRFLALVAVLAITAPALVRGVNQAAFDAVNHPQMEK